MKKAISNIEPAIKFFSLIAVLFAVLLTASYSNEILKQLVIVPGSAAELGLSADCREDELLEEGLSQQECELMVANVQIILASSPEWFRGFQIFYSSLGGLVSVACLFFAGASYRLEARPLKLVNITLGILLALDILGFSAALFTGPMLRSLYLWPLVIWFFVHLSLFLAGRRLQQIGMHV